MNPLHYNQSIDYKGVSIALFATKDKEVFIPRDCVSMALGYQGNAQLSRMQCRYPHAFQKEYMKEYHYYDMNEKLKHGIGLYTIKGVIEVCMHTQRFRESSNFLIFLKSEFARLDFPDFELPENKFLSRSADRELLLQVVGTMGKMEQLLTEIIKKLEEKNG